MKNFKSWSRLDILWTVFSLAVITCVCILTWDSSDHLYSALSLVGTVFGMLNVILVAKCEVWVNITTAVLVEVAMGLCYLHWNMLGNAVLNLFIFLPSNIAFIHWVKKQRDNTVPVRRLSAKRKAVLAAITLAVTIIGGLWLSGVNAQTPIVGEFMNAQFYGGSNPAPYLDAFSFTANIMALVLMYCLFIEQWYLWVLVDAIALVMWIVTAVSDPSMIAYNYVAMYLLWLLNAIYGVRCWKRSLIAKDSFMKKVGLTLGKYAPLHKGHEYVIETMLREMDEVIVIIYDSALTQIPLPVRAGWIKKLFPTVTVIEAWDGPQGEPHSREYEIMEEQFILGLLDGRQITAFYSGEYYGEHMSKALGCIDRRMTEPRLISATQIRQDAFAHRQFISDVVYRDLIVKAVFLGAMSTGKSTITAALATRYSTTYASEYGRDYWDTHQVDRRISPEAFDEIAAGHLAREEDAFVKANRYCFVDTNAITTYMFSLDYHGVATPSLTQLALENASRYDLFFLCEDDIPYDDTWDRSGDQKRHVFQQQIVADLHARRIPFIPLRGSLEQRMVRVDEVLQDFAPYSNYFGRKI